MTTTIRLAGLELPRIGLGTNRLTSENVDFIRDAVAAGLRHIDTAHLYTGGESERAIGAAGVPDDVLVATKGGYGGAGQGRPEIVRAQIEQSLKSLRVDAIGLYYLHQVDPETPLEEGLGRSRSTSTGARSGTSASPTSASPSSSGRARWCRSRRCRTATTSRSAKTTA